MTLSSSDPPVIVYLGLGTNKGNRESHLLNGVQALSSILGMMMVSSVYETDPVEVLDQPRFLNAVVSGFFKGSAEELLERIHAVEESEGRDRSRERRKGERPLDIDILLYGQRIITSDTLTIPHEAIRERLFVLVPLLELSPSLCEPGTGRPYESYRAELNGVPGQGIYTFPMKLYSLSDGTVRASDRGQKEF